MNYTQTTPRETTCNSLLQNTYIHGKLFLHSSATTMLSMWAQGQITTSRTARAVLWRLSRY